MAKPSKLAGALAKDPKLNRVSPGVYRNAQGGLVNSRGGALPGQRPQQPQRPPQQVPGRFQPANPSQYPGGQQQPATRPPAPNAGQNAGNVPFNYPPQEYYSAVTPNNRPQNPMQLSPNDMRNIGTDRIGNQVWNGPGNGPGSPNDVNPNYNPNQQMPPMNDLMYRYPQGQAPDFGAMFRYFEQQRQQPNTVSGILQQGGQQPQNEQQPQQPQQPINPYIKQY